MHWAAPLEAFLRPFELGLPCTAPRVAEPTAAEPKRSGDLEAEVRQGDFEPAEGPKMQVFLDVHSVFFPCFSMFFNVFNLLWPLLELRKPFRKANQVQALRTKEQSMLLGVSIAFLAKDFLEEARPTFSLLLYITMGLPFLLYLIVTIPMRWSCTSAPPRTPTTTRLVSISSRLGAFRS